MTTIENIDAQIKVADKNLQEAINAAASRDPVCIRFHERIQVLVELKKVIQENGKSDEDTPPPSG